MTKPKYEIPEYDPYTGEKNPYYEDLTRTKIVFVADIADDIDDVIAIEYLNSVNLLECVVLDGKSRDSKREKELGDIGVIFKTEIPENSKILFCGGALTKIAEFVKENKIELLVANGGFVGNNIVPISKALKKFKNKEKVRTYNFNMDVDAALSVIESDNIDEILLVSKNVCHSSMNCINKMHTESFLDKYNLDEGKRLHDLLMVKEGVSYMNDGIDNMRCGYLNIKPICDRETIDNMSRWGGELDDKNDIKMSIYIK